MIPQPMPTAVNGQQREVTPTPVEPKLLAEKPYKRWPITGPRTVSEFVLALYTAGFEGFNMYHAEWVRRSGISPSRLRAAATAATAQ